MGEAKLPAAARLLLADPADVTVQDGHPLDSHTGLGLTAFSYALTLANGSTLMAGLSLLMGTLVMAGAVGLMGMDASHLPLLWLYSVCAIAVVSALETQLRMATPEPGRRVLTVPAARDAVIAALLVRALPAPVA